MKKELQQQLFTKYPKLFVNVNRIPPYSPMAFGIGVGDGWYNLIDELCSHLNDLYEVMGNDCKFTQIKEKFGRLTCYLEDANYYQQLVASDFGGRSEYVCEECGRVGRLREGAWLKTLCDDHEAKRCEPLNDEQKAEIKESITLAFGKFWEVGQ